MACTNVISLLLLNFQELTKHKLPENKAEFTVSGGYMPQRKYRRFSNTFFDSFPQSCKLIWPHFEKNIPLKLKIGMHNTVYKHNFFIQFIG